MLCWFAFAVRYTRSCFARAHGSGALFLLYALFSRRIASLTRSEKRKYKDIADKDIYIYIYIYIFKWINKVDIDGLSMVTMFGPTPPPAFMKCPPAPAGLWRFPVSRHIMFWVSGAPQQNPMAPAGSPWLLLAPGAWWFLVAAGGSSISSSSTSTSGSSGSILAAMAPVAAVTSLTTWWNPKE